MRNIRSFRVFGLVMVAVLVLGVSGLASAQTMPVNNANLLQATQEPTPIDLEVPVVLAAGKPSQTPIDNENMTYRKFTFSGKANQIITVSARRLTGNFSFNVDVNSQTSTELASASGSFLEQVDLTVKLPQDGNYTLRIDRADPGSGDFTAGTASVWFAEGVPGAAATAAATASK